jgi:uncharacterized protein
LSKTCIFVSLLDKTQMKLLLGRDKQIQEFEDAIASDESQFIAITGRRRVGKTYLVNTYFGDEICFYLTGIQNQPTSIQLEAFTNELQKRSKQKIEVPNDWLEALFLLRNYLEKIKTKKKKIIFFDELPWMDTQRSGFIQKFAHFWNSWAGWTKDIIIIIAGSSTSWIVNKIYNDRGGFHNRVTKRIWLKPFKLSETELFLKHKKINFSQYDIAILYMAFGGVPYYLNEIKKGESVTQCIQRLCFSENGLLQTEFENLYVSIFAKADAHIKVVKILAKHNYGLGRSELLKKAKIANSGGSSKILEDLIAVGYIDYLVPFGNRANSGKYILTDYYTKFYLSFIENGNNTNWNIISISNIFKTWCGFSFERLCYDHIYEIVSALGIGATFKNSSNLILKEANKINAQIDLVIERRDNALNLCEIKFSDKEYKLTALEAKKIANRKNNLATKIKSKEYILPTMITTFGCARNMHYINLIQNQVVLSDLFLPLKNYYYN